MKINKLYEIADKENIKIYDWYIEDCYGVYLNVDKINAIALNYDEIGTYIDEKIILAEELGHYYCDATYPLECTNETLINKQEYRAKKWSYTTLVPYNQLKIAINKGITLLWELADYFEVTNEYMQNCLDFYFNKYGNTFLEEV